MIDIFEISWVQLYLWSKVWHQQMPNLIKGNLEADWGDSDTV